MSATHYIKKCQGCGVVMEQCRCPGPKEERFGFCDACAKNAVMAQPTIPPPMLDSTGHFPGCKTIGCLATRCAEARALSGWRPAVLQPASERDQELADLLRWLRVVNTSDGAPDPYLEQLLSLIETERPHRARG